MTCIETTWTNKTYIMENTVKYVKYSASCLLNNVKKFMSNLIPDTNSDIDAMKKEVWANLSAVYYKYDCDDHKRAFREVTYEIAEKVLEGKWNAIYKKFYRMEQKI